MRNVFQSHGLILAIFVLLVGCGDSLVDQDYANRFDADPNNDGTFMPDDGNPSVFVPLATPTPTPSPSPTPSGDTQAPTVPQNLDFTFEHNDFYARLTWDAASDNVGVHHYKVERVGGAMGPKTWNNIMTTEQLDNSALPGETASYSVAAVDAAGNISAFSTPIMVTFADDTQPPSAPPSISLVSNMGVCAITWAGSSDNHGIRQYRIFRDSVFRASVAYSSLLNYTDSQVTPAVTYTYNILAEDWSGNYSMSSSNVSCTPVGAPDTEAPTAPSNLAATPSTGAAVLTWMAATDNVGVSAYRVYRKLSSATSYGSHIASTSVLFYANFGLTSGETYNYIVRAIDVAGNLSDPSNEITVTIP